MNITGFATLFLLGTVAVFGFIARAYRRGAFVRDSFPTSGRRQAGVALLVTALILTVVAPFASGLASGPVAAPSVTPVSAFLIHFILVGFLVAYYFLSGRPPILDFLRIRTRHPFRLALAGFPIAAFAWGSLVLGTLLATRVLSLAAPAMSPRPEVSPVIPWMVAQPVAFRVAIVVSAMFVEEFFFRSFLQPRIGAVGATLFFTLAHGSYGEPLLLVGILILAGVLALSFELYQNALPGIVAHGAFDSFEMFVLIPAALKFLGAL